MTRQERVQAWRIGREVANARKALGWTQEQVASRLRIPQSRVAAVELGRSALSQAEIAEAVGIDTPPAPNPRKQGAEP